MYIHAFILTIFYKLGIPYSFKVVMRVVWDKSGRHLIRMFSGRIRQKNQIYLTHYGTQAGK